jgi:glycosyltransferase involved in cell wall biosynthesis
VNRVPTFAAHDLVMCRSIQSVIYTDPNHMPPLINECRLLAAAGYHVSIIGRGYQDNRSIAYPEGTTLLRVPVRAIPSVVAFVHFIVQAVLHADRSARVYIGHDMHGLVVARLLASLHRRPLVYHSHDFVETERRLSGGAGVVRWLERRFARTADLVVVPDADRAKIVAEALHLRASPLVVANAPMSRPPHSGQRLRDELAARGFHFHRIVLRQGTIGRGHGIEMTIRSIPLWKSKSWGFVLIGMPQTGYVQEVEALVHALGVDRQVVVLPPVSYDEVLEFTGGASVGHALYDPIHVNNLHITTASNKIMEYMAAGLPLLVSDRPGLRRLVETYGCGVAADEQSPESIAAAINALLAAATAAEAMGRAAFGAFARVFCFERQFGPELEALESLISLP